MKDYDGFIKMNEASSELALLSNLYSFFLQKYDDKEIAKTKFKEQVNSLQDHAEISIKSVKKFFKENGIIAGIEVGTKSKIGFAKFPNSRESGCGSSYDAGCGSVPSYVRPYSNNSCGSSSNSGC